MAMIHFFHRFGIGNVSSPLYLVDLVTKRKQDAARWILKRQSSRVLFLSRSKNRLSPFFHFVVAATSWALPRSIDGDQTQGDLLFLGEISVPLRKYLFP
jgi:hypothetical protein